MIIITTLVGEIKIYPFHDTFRVSFGTTAFLFFLLLMKKSNPIFSGIMVGFSVVLFRIFLYLAFGGNTSLLNGFILNFPAFFYYLTYSALFYILLRKYLNHYLLLGFLSAFIEIISNLVELSLRHTFLGDSLSINILIKVAIIAIIRSFFVLGFFYVLVIHEKDIEVEKQHEENSKMALFISNLYEETIQLKKSFNTSEEITHDCYNLYRSLKDSNEDLSKKLLDIAGKIHEVKKDNQRTYSSLSKLITSENLDDYMNINDIATIITNTNKKYANSLDKDIEILTELDNISGLFHLFIILSILNNLISNSVEAIEKVGTIKLSIKKQSNFLQFVVTDNGPGIPDKKLKLVFKAGYTNKYNSLGKPSTGIGLSYVKEIVYKLGGSINLKSVPEKHITSFTILIPAENLTKRG